MTTPDFIGNALRTHGLDKRILRASETGWRDWGEMPLVWRQATREYIKWRKEDPDGDQA